MHLLLPLIARGAHRLAGACLGQDIAVAVIGINHRTLPTKRVDKINRFNTVRKDHFTVDQDRVARAFFSDGIPVADIQNQCDVGIIFLIIIEVKADIITAVKNSRMVLACRGVIVCIIAPVYIPAAVRGKVERVIVPCVDVIEGDLIDAVLNLFHQVFFCGWIPATSIQEVAVTVAGRGNRIDLISRRNNIVAFNPDLPCIGIINNRHIA